MKHVLGAVGLRLDVDREGHVANVDVERLAVRVVPVEGAGRAHPLGRVSHRLVRLQLVHLDADGGLLLVVHDDESDGGRLGAAHNNLR